MWDDATGYLLSDTQQYLLLAVLAAAFVAAVVEYWKGPHDDR